MSSSSMTRLGSLFDNDVNGGTSMCGSCCNEMNIRKTDSMAMALTPHVCTSQGQTRCSGTSCDDGGKRYGGVYEKDSFDFNSFRMDEQPFLGTGLTVDTASKLTSLHSSLPPTTPLRACFSKSATYMCRTAMSFRNHRNGRIWLYHRRFSLLPTSGDNTSTFVATSGFRL